TPIFSDSIIGELDQESPRKSALSTTAYSQNTHGHRDLSGGWTYCNISLRLKSAVGGAAYLTIL
ncbi:MAG: hypothetical protein ACFCBU_17645, partial [Cyanophyceae cyanobacterium]